MPGCYGTSCSTGHKMRTGVNIRDVYKMGKTIGTGGFSVVKLATDRHTGEQWACKVMSLPPPGKQYNENESSRADIFKEIDILLSLEHPNIVLMKEYFEENNKVYLIMEMLSGGELLDAVLDKGHYSEADARSCFLQIIKAVQYLHSRGIVHRDLKLENLLLVHKKDISHIKIADFGLARRYAGPSALTTICGTPQYVAPEIIKASVGHGAGRPSAVRPRVRPVERGGHPLERGGHPLHPAGRLPPFYDESEPRLFEKIRKGSFNFNDEVWTAVSDEAKDLIKNLLVVDPRSRLTIPQVLAHPWCKKAEGRKRELLKTTTRMRTSKIQLGLLPESGSPTASAPMMEAAKSGAVLDLEEQKLAEELAAEAAGAR
ncbi:hypothetical protein ABPG77_006677 [Micractinium sp. CCAP 211/92]